MPQARVDFLLRSLDQYMHFFSPISNPWGVYNPSYQLRRYRFCIHIISYRVPISAERTETQVGGTASWILHG